MGLFACFSGQAALVESIEQPDKKHDTVPKSMTRNSVRKSLRSVNLSKNQIAKIDPKFWLNTNLEDINLSNNKSFTKVPDEIEKLTKLKILDISFTAVGNLGGKFWNLKSLQELNLSHCKFSGSFPAGIGRLVNLKLLDLNHNKITILPDELNKCTKLQHLNVSYNRLAKLSTRYGPLVNLEELQLQSNELEYLPKCVDEWKKLSVLKVDVSQVEKQPELIPIDVEGNPAYSTKYFKDDSEIVVTLQQTETVQAAAPIAKPIAPARGDSKLMSTTATIENTRVIESETTDADSVRTDTESAQDATVSEATGLSVECSVEASDISRKTVSDSNVDDKEALVEEPHGDDKENMKKSESADEKVDEIVDEKVNGDHEVHEKLEGETGGDKEEEKTNTTTEETKITNNDDKREQEATEEVLEHNSPEIQAVPKEVENTKSDSHPLTALVEATEATAEAIEEATEKATETATEEATETATEEATEKATETATEEATEKATAEVAKISQSSEIEKDSNSPDKTEEAKNTDQFDDEVSKLEEVITEVLEKSFHEADQEEKNGAEEASVSSGRGSQGSLVSSTNTSAAVYNEKAEVPSKEVQVVNNIKVSDVHVSPKSTTKSTTSSVQELDEPIAVGTVTPGGSVTEFVEPAAPHSEISDTGTEDGSISSSQRDEISPTGSDKKEKKFVYVKSTVVKEHEAVIKSRKGSVKDAARMFQSAAEESAKSKTSTPQTVRRMPNRQSIQTDQSTQRLVGVVRVAVPLPEGYIDVKSKPQVEPPKRGSIFDDKYGEPDPRISTYDNMSDMSFDGSPTHFTKKQSPLVEKKNKLFQYSPKISPTLPEKHSTEHDAIFPQAPTFAFDVPKAQVFAAPPGVKNSVNDSTVTNVTQAKSVSSTTTVTDKVYTNSTFESENRTNNFAVTKSASSRSSSRSIGHEYGLGGRLPFATIVRNLDFDSEPMEFSTKAQKKTKKSSMGLSVTDGEDVNPMAVFVTAFTANTETEWLGDDSPRPGDVLVSIDGSQVNSKTFESVMADCGNNITFKFHRFPGTFSGY